MILDSGGIKSITKDIINKWKYTGLVKWGKDIYAFWTNSKHQFYQLKNSRKKGYKLIKVISQSYKRAI